MRAPVLLCLSLALVGCSGDPAALPTADPTASASAGPTASSPQTSAPATPATTPTVRPTARVLAVDGDVDGDGRADTISPTTGKLTVTMSGSGRAVSVAVSAETPGAPELLGTADLDRDGRVEVFLETARGASTAFATPYRFDGVRLQELTIGGDPARLGMGGTVTHGEGFRCRADGLLEVLSAESPDGERFTVTRTTFRVAAAELVQVRRTSSTGKQGDPAVNAAFTVDCGSVTSGEP